MSGGLAFVYDFDGRLPRLCNEDVAGDLCPLDPVRDEPLLVSLLQRHVRHTGSTVARAILADWQAAKSRFVKVFPHEYRRALAEAEATAAKEKAEKETEARMLAALGPEVDEAKAREAADLALARALLLPGESAFDALKRLGMDKMARGEGLPAPPASTGSPALDLARLTQDALDGRPVAGREPTWEGSRPVAVKAGTAVKRRGFIDYRRNPLPYRSVAERVHDWDEVQVCFFFFFFARGEFLREGEKKGRARAKSGGDGGKNQNFTLFFFPPSLLPFPKQARLPGAEDADQLATQSARCMGCGTPFCHQTATGCPLGNKVPEFNALVAAGQWRDALDRLLETNNFPEFTGRVCPAPCEGSCVLGINEPPVTIKTMEVSIIDRAFEEG